jgi:hypothetical protein
MDSLHRASATLLISGDSLVPDELTALLGVQPTLGIRKGETFRASHGEEIEARKGKWFFGGNWRSPPDLDEQISELLLALPSRTELWVELTSRFECWLSIGAYLGDWTGGITLAPATLKLLAERNLAIDLDLYAHAASD